MDIGSLLIMGPFILFVYGTIKVSDKLDKEDLEKYIKKDKKEENV